METYDFGLWWVLGPIFFTSTCLMRACLNSRLMPQISLLWMGYIKLYRQLNVEGQCDYCVAYCLFRYNQFGILINTFWKFQIWQLARIWRKAFKRRGPRFPIPAQSIGTISYQKSEKRCWKVSSCKNRAHLESWTFILAENILQVGCIFDLLCFLGRKLWFEENFP